MTADRPGDPVPLPTPGTRALRWALGAAAASIGLLQLAVGLQVDRVGPLVGGAVLLVLGAALVLGGRGVTVVDPDGIHAPDRLRDRELPWSAIAALRTRSAPGGRVQLVAERAGRPRRAAVRVAVLRPEDAERLLPAVGTHATAHDVPLHDDA